MSGAPRNPDKLNTIGIVVVGVCGAVLVYVSIIALQAFYMNDTQEVQTTADFGGQQTGFQSIKAAQLANLTGEGLKEDPKLESTIADLDAKLQADPSNAALRKQDDDAKGQRRYHEPIETAMAQVIATKDQTQMIPGFPETVGSIAPIFGRPQPLAGAGSAAPASGSGSAAPAPTAGSADGSAAAPAAGSDAGSAAAPASGSGAGSGSATATPAPIPATVTPTPAPAPVRAAAVPPRRPAPAPAAAPAPTPASSNPPATDTRVAPPVSTGGGAASGVGAPPPGSTTGTATGSAATPPNAP